MFCKIEMKRYLITDPAYYPSTPELFTLFFYQILSHHRPDYACLRDFDKARRTSLASAFVEACHARGVLAMVNGDIELACQIPFDGVHLKGNQMEMIPRAHERGIKVFYSAHTIDEMIAASDKGAKGVMISPIFPSPGKGSGRGVEFLRTIPRSRLGCEVFALGGIVGESELLQLQEINTIDGFASIRFFTNHTNGLEK